ncbi:MAG: hypothetical protein Q7P63_11220 [Verrucomicrobiota bacterium JB022]|nr:hypothetical protein [Verrucomicrobiota bacterium JB022]
MQALVNSLFNMCRTVTNVSARCPESPLRGGSRPGARLETK